MHSSQSRGKQQVSAENALLCNPSLAAPSATVMNTALFSDDMQMETMFSPPGFRKQDQSPTMFPPDVVNMSERTQDDGTEPPFKSILSSFSFAPVYDVSRPELFPLSLPPGMTMSLSSCLPPSASIIGPEDMPSPEVGLGDRWYASRSPSYSPMLQDDAECNWDQAIPILKVDVDAHHQQRYGQLTPPDDSPVNVKSLSTAHVGTKDNEKSIDENFTSRKSASNNKRGPKASSKVDSAAPVSKRSRKGRLSAKGEGSGDLEDDAKRERFLERNRLAASKCRQKKKEWTSALEEDERHQKAFNTYLQQCVAQLKGELLYLKGECLRHSDCDCVAIREHMRSTIPFMVRPSQALYDGDSVPLPASSIRRHSVSVEGGIVSRPGSASSGGPSTRSEMSVASQDDEIQYLRSTSSASDRSR